jgi:hypothetical protein
MVSQIVAFLLGLLILCELALTVLLIPALILVGRLAIHADSGTSPAEAPSTGRT